MNLYDERGEYWLSDFSSASRQADRCSLSSGSTVCWRMLLSSRGTLVQSCIGAMSRSVSRSRWHRRSCSHHYIVYIDNSRSPFHRYTRSWVVKINVKYWMLKKFDSVQSYITIKGRLCITIVNSVNAVVAETPRVALYYLEIEDFRARTVDICCSCPIGVIRFRASNSMTYVKIVEIGFKIRKYK